MKSPEKNSGTSCIGRGSNFEAVREPSAQPEADSEIQVPVAEPGHPRRMSPAAIVYIRAADPEG